MSALAFENARWSRTASPELPPRSMVVGLATPQIVQVKNDAHFRPKDHGRDGSFWNDPNNQAPLVRQALYARPDLDQQAAERISAKAQHLDDMARKEALEKLIVRRGLGRQQYLDRKAERLQLEARAGQRHSAEAVAFFTDLEHDKQCLLRSLRVDMKAQSTTRATSRPQSAASHTSAASVLAAYEYARLHLPAPTNQVSASAEFSHALQQSLRPEQARQLALTLSGTAGFDGPLLAQSWPSQASGAPASRPLSSTQQHVHNLGVDSVERFDFSALTDALGQALDGDDFLHADGSGLDTQRIGPDSGVDTSTGTGRPSSSSSVRQAAAGTVGSLGDGCSQHHLYLPAQASVPTLANVSLELAVKGIQRKDRQYFGDENGWNKLALVPDSRLKLIQFPERDAEAIRAIDRRAKAEEVEEVRRFQRRRDVHDQISAEFRNQTILNRQKEMHVGLRVTEELSPSPMGPPPPSSDLAFRAASPSATSPAFAPAAASHPAFQSISPSARSIHFSALSAPACASQPLSASMSALPVSRSATRVPLAASLSAARLLQRSQSLQGLNTQPRGATTLPAAALVATAGAAGVAAGVSGSPFQHRAVTLAEQRYGSSQRPQTSDGLVWPDDDRLSDASFESARSRLLKPKTTTDLPVYVTHDHRDYMGLTDTLRNTALAPVHAHTHVHSRSQRDALAATRSASAASAVSAPSEQRVDSNSPSRSLSQLSWHYPRHLSRSPVSRSPQPTQSQLQQQMAADMELLVEDRHLHRSTSQHQLWSDSSRFRLSDLTQRAAKQQHQAARQKVVIEASQVRQDLAEFERSLKQQQQQQQQAQRAAQ